MTASELIERLKHLPPDMQVTLMPMPAQVMPQEVEVRVEYYVKVRRRVEEDGSTIRKYGLIVRYHEEHQLAQAVAAATLVLDAHLEDYLVKEAAPYRVVDLDGMEVAL